MELRNKLILMIILFLAVICVKNTCFGSTLNNDLNVDSYNVEYDAAFQSTFPDFTTWSDFYGDGEEETILNNCKIALEIVDLPTENYWCCISKGVVHIMSVPADVDYIPIVGYQYVSSSGNICYVIDPDFFTDLAWCYCLSWLYNGYGESFWYTDYYINSTYCAFCTTNPSGNVNCGIYGATVAVISSSYYNFGTISLIYDGEFIVTALKDTTIEVTIGTNTFYMSYENALDFSTALEYSYGYIIRWNVSARGSTNSSYFEVVFLFNEEYDDDGNELIVSTYLVDNGVYIFSYGTTEDTYNSAYVIEYNYANDEILDQYNIGNEDYSPIDFSASSNQRIYIYDSTTTQYVTDELSELRLYTDDEDVRGGSGISGGRSTWR